ncbi:MAG: radical SAM protein, partial [Candidatus Methanomethyliaceae archaeon]
MLRIFKISEDIPLMGTVYFGIIDRGTNVLQIRPSTSCPLNCIFCSTDAGPKSKNRQTEYIVDLDILIKWIREIVKIKGMGIEAHIDTVGDPLTYPWLIDLIQNLKELREISIISIQTHGYLLNERIIEELEAAGLSRINLSIDALDEDLAKILGYFTAEGNYLFESRKGYTHYGEPKGMQFTFRGDDFENIDLMRTLIEKLFKRKPKEKKDPRYNVLYLYVYDSKISRIFYQAGFRKYGRLPQIIFNSPISV